MQMLFEIEHHKRTKELTHTFTDAGFSSGSCLKNAPSFYHPFSSCPLCFYAVVATAGSAPSAEDYT